MSASISRREVLRRGAVAATAAAAASSISLADDAPKKKLPIGLQLYSVRNELAKDFTGVIQQVGKMGYQGVEFAGFHDRSATDICSSAGATGASSKLVAASTISRGDSSKLCSHNAAYLPPCPISSSCVPRSMMRP